MSLLLWILVGWAVGWLTGKSLEGKGYGPSMDVIMGIGGAVLGGTLARSAGLSGYAGTIVGTFAAMIFASFFTILAGLVNGRRLYSRRL